MNFNASTFDVGDITLNKTYDTTGSMGVAGSGLTRTMAICSITVIGLLGIFIMNGAVSDSACNLVPATGPSITFKDDTILPSYSWLTPS